MKPRSVACVAFMGCVMAYIQSMALQAHTIPLQIQNSDKVTSETIQSPSLFAHFIVMEV